MTGEFENYTTPEQEVPDKPLDHPWETCMTMGNSWSFVPGDKYKSSHDLIQLLVKIVSRGGNFLLNIGPGPDGDWDPIAYERLKDIGAWMKVNGEGIYASKPIAPYSTGRVFFTQSSAQKVIYAFYLFDKDEQNLPAKIALGRLAISKSAKVEILGMKDRIRLDSNPEGAQILVPQTVASKIKNRDAIVFKISN